MNYSNPQVNQMTTEIHQVLKGLNECRYKKNIKNERTLKELEYYIRALTHMQQSLVGNTSPIIDSTYLTPGYMSDPMNGNRPVQSMTFPNTSLVMGTISPSVMTNLPIIRTQGAAANPSMMPSTQTTAEIEAYANQLELSIRNKLHGREFDSRQLLENEVQRHVSGEMSVPTDHVVPVSRLITEKLISS